MIQYLIPLIFSTVAAIPPICPEIAPSECGPESMTCPGGMDSNGCMMPDMCMPMMGPLGLDGNECPAFCPANCGPENIICSGGMDSNGCKMPDMCIPSKGPPDFHGNQCPALCPANCAMVVCMGMDA